MMAENEELGEEVESKESGVEEEIPEGAPNQLIDMEQYLASGVHIGTRQKTGAMNPYIYRVRPDGLFVLDVQQADERIDLAARLIASFEPEDTYVVSARQYGQRPVSKFGEVTGARISAGRFIPGTFTNPSYENYIEPKLLVVTDPVADEQPLAEAATIGMPVIGLCDTDNDTRNIDLVIPTNNRGRKSLALVYWLLARQVLRERGELAPGEELDVSLEEFETKFEEE